MKEYLTKFIIGINKLIVFLLLGLSVVNIITPVFIPYNNHLHMVYFLEIHHTVKRLFSFIILIIAWKLYKRVSMAWFITMSVLSLSIFQYLLICHHYQIFNLVILLEIICYFILLLSKNYYCRKLNKYSIKKGILIYFSYIIFVFFNAVIALLKERGTVSLYTCIKKTVAVMLSFNLNNLTIQDMIYHSFIFWFSWGCIIIGLIFVLTPYINTRAHHVGDLEKARVLVKKYGQNCSSYLALEKDKSLYFGKSVEGVIAYGIVKDILVVLGDPICNPKNFVEFLAEIKNFCQTHAYNLLFLNTTGMYIKQYEKLGMGYTKCGVEPRFYLPEYSLAGGNASKIRLNINHATKSGLIVKEYDPRKSRNLSLEKKITEVSQEWFTMKKSGELVFSLGKIGFENPLDRRYFYAVNATNEIEGFTVFVPYNGMNGYMADITRRRKSATRGVTEKIFYEAMMTFKEEGIEWGSLAVAPLARLEGEPVITERLLNTIYEKMNYVYGFKTLYQAKLKYNPTYWVPSYFVYYPAIFTPSMAYAIIRIQNPQGIKDYVKAFFRNRRKSRLEK